MERGAGDSSWSRTASSYKRGHGIEKSLSQQIAYSQDTGACVGAELGQTSHYRQFKHEIEAEFPAQSETGPSTQSRGQSRQYWWSTGQQQPWGAEDCTFLKHLPSHWRSIQVLAGSTSVVVTCLYLQAWWVSCCWQRPQKCLDVPQATHYPVKKHSYIIEW